MKVFFQWASIWLLVSFIYWIVALPLTGHETREHYKRPWRVASRLKIATWLWLALTVWLIVVSPINQLQREKRLKSRVPATNFIGK